MKSNAQSRIAANDQTPWIGVHAMTEFMFCPRAGVLAYEQGAGNDEQDERPNVRYLPDWNLVAIEQGLREVKLRLGVLLLALLLVSSIGVVQFQRGTGVWQLLLIVGAIVIGSSALRQLRSFWTLMARVREARRTAPRMPNEGSSQSEPVNWWSLLGAGFESVKYEDALRDERLRLAGRPWRVLRHGSLRIPVFRVSGEPRLRRQHFARIAAYCHLLETCEGCRSPYGVAIFAGTYDGVTVRNSPATRKAFHDGLVLARSVVQRANHRSPAPPANGKGCLGCPHGFPRAQTKRWFRALAGYAKQGVDGRFYNSGCGDRYQWVPPHEKAIRKRLV